MVVGFNIMHFKTDCCKRSLVICSHIINRKWGGGVKKWEEKMCFLSGKVRAGNKREKERKHTLRHFKFGSYIRVVYIYTYVYLFDCMPECVERLYSYVRGFIFSFTFNVHTYRNIVPRYSYRRTEKNAGSFESQ